MKFARMLAMVLALSLSVIAVWFGALNQDEGWYLYAAQMVQSGKFPYRDFFFTQGPAMPFVYSVLSPIWGMSSPLHGLLGGRVVTWAIGLLSTLCAISLVRRLVPCERRSLAGFSVFCLLACNLYHVYFTTIPKTYALGSLFLMAGLLLITVGLSGKWWMLFLGGMSLAFATGTRISLLLILPVVGFVLLFNFRLFRWAFLWFGLGGMLGLFLTYGIFALDPESLEGLLAAQKYHAGRGGFDPFFVTGSISRLSRGYAALGVVLFAWVALRMKRENSAIEKPVQSVLLMLALGFASVFCLQLSAPFPYDDYQVPVMSMLTVLIVALFANCVQDNLKGMWFVVLTAGLASFSSPMLQEWSTLTQDRFWSQKKEITELDKLRKMGREINVLDPEGTTLLTQDLYLAIETGRTVPHGLEMGPFCYFPDMPTKQAKSIHVMNRELMTELVKSAPCNIAACSGYAFAIAVPKCSEVPFDEQMRFYELLRENYELKDAEPDFGQNATRLLLLTRKQESEK